MRSILITGASTGFGRNVALAMAEDGWRVFASMRDPAKGADLVEAVAGAAGSIEIVALDVTDPVSLETGIAGVLAATGGTIDALLNNAGYSILGAFEDISDAQCRQQMETNFFGTLAVTRAVLPAMRQAGRGRIVVITSNAVNTPHPMLSMYAASKWALEGWAEALAMEVAPFGVEVAVVQPGAHRTPFANNVVSVLPEPSAYRQWLDMAMPGIANLDAWGRDPAKATAPIVAALSEANPSFRRTVGEDTAAFAALKGLFPYEVREWALRAIVGLPEARQFVEGETTVRVFDQVLARIVSHAAERPGELGGALLTGMKG